MDNLTDQQIAQHFHAEYEKLAPSFGYETRLETRKEWSELPENNRALMTAVCGKVRALIAARPVDKDGERLNWLETMVVNVRDPLLYGSRDLFWATPENDDPTYQAGPSDIRTKIDAAIAQAHPKADFFSDGINDQPLPALREPV